MKKGLIGGHVCIFMQCIDGHRIYIDILYMYIYIYTLDAVGNVLQDGWWGILHPVRFRGYHGRLSFRPFPFHGFGVAHVGRGRSWANDPGLDLSTSLSLICGVRICENGWR